MFTFSRTGNVLIVEVDDSVLSLSPASLVHVKDGKIHISQVEGEAFSVVYPHKPTLTLSPLVINGRPTDDVDAVAAWLRTDYFFGFDYSGGGGGSWPADYATNTLQTSQLSVLNDILTEEETNNDRRASSYVNEKFDEKEFVYLGNGDIDYIAFKLATSEVARLTFTYDIDGNLTNIVKT